ncbi:MAG: nucleotidyltransferase [Bacteroidetes bacterium 43-93]|nr:nucleotidyltransferase family protein [Bacteroidota bacterium]OJW99360.1 MAG: nucleotidyltransferase [Bacteroidetes bacterium 43-93]
MALRQEILSTLKQAKNALTDRYGIQALALFGSYSREDANTDSDVDILVELKSPIGIRFIDLADELETLLHRKVDLVSRNGIKPKYFASIERDLIYV